MRQVFWVYCLALVALLGSLASPLAAQTGGIVMRVDGDAVGLGGAVRPGSWTPLRVNLDNQGERREVVVQWRLADVDGDQVLATRRAVANPGREQAVWLYGVPPVDTRGDAAWTVQVKDAATGEPIETQTVRPRVPVSQTSPRMSLIGLAGSAGLGLDPYTEQYTQHEPIGILRGLSLETLPDRWYGLDALHSLIWVQDGGDPNAAAFLPAMQAALREWVRRGGHLIVVLPPFGEPWSGSPMADLLPVPADAMRRVEGTVPNYLYDIAPVEKATIQMHVFDVPDSGAPGQAAVLLRNDANEPVVVAKRYGFGRVTLVGIDLSEGRLVRMGVPGGSFRIWNTIYGWNSPAYTNDRAQRDMGSGNLVQIGQRGKPELGGFVAGIIAMTEQAAPALLLAIVVFLLYWLAAGPLGFALLKSRGQVRKSWLAFVAVVGLFTVIAWGGAWLLQPRGREIAHFSVVDIDGRTGLVRTQSWLSLFIPEFGEALVSVPGGDVQTPNTLASPGLVPMDVEQAFLNPQPYEVDAAAPSRAEIPVRATAKQFTVDYLGALAEGQTGVEGTWVAPQGELRIDNGWPRGTLAHNLPGTLTSVLAVYVPPRADIPGAAAVGRAGAMPFVWRLGEWAPQTPLQIDEPRQSLRLVQRPPAYEGIQRSFIGEGFLGQHLGNAGGLNEEDGAAILQLPDDQRVRVIEMLSFYDALPPPDVFRTNGSGFADFPNSYQRSLGRNLDLTPHTVGAKLILIGHLRGSPLPAPLLVDEQAIADYDADSWTVVRWIYDL